MIFDPHAVEQLTVEQLRAGGGSKWNTFPGQLGAFVAEMDFGVAPSILRAVQHQTDHAAFAYTPESLMQEARLASAEWLGDRFGWQVQPTHIGLLPEVLTALQFMLDTLIPAGSPVILPTPAYMPFLRMPQDFGHPVIEVPSILDETTGRWQLNEDGIDRAFAGGASLLILTNPNNPTGTVYTRAELERISEIVARRGGRVWADEIHAPIVYGQASHVPYATVGEEGARHSVTATSASKGWNIPGLKCAQIVLTNRDDLAAWRSRGRWLGHATGQLGVLATIAAYRDGREWLSGVTEYLADNQRLFVELAAEHLPESRVYETEATYLAWLDLRGYRLDGSPASDVNLGRYFQRTASVAGTDGRLCGADFAGHYRLNYATTRPILRQIFEQLGDAV